jgi:hypothetical protein
MLLAVSRCRPARWRRVPHHTAACPHGLRSCRDAANARGLADDTGGLAAGGLVWSKRGTRTTQRRRGTLGRGRRREQAVLVQASTSRWLQTHPSSPGTTVGTWGPPALHLEECTGHSELAVGGRRGAGGQGVTLGDEEDGGDGRPRWSDAAALSLLERA